MKVYENAFDANIMDVEILVEKAELDVEIDARSQILNTLEMAMAISSRDIPLLLAKEQITQLVHNLDKLWKKMDQTPRVRVKNIELREELRQVLAPMYVDRRPVDANEFVGVILDVLEATG